MYSCIILDDDVMAIGQLKVHIAKRDDLLLKRTFTNAKGALTYLKNERIDIVFLDILMPHILGTDVAKIIKEDCIIIFTTNSSKHAIDAYDIGAVDYLTKPIASSRFNEAVDRAILPLQFKELTVNEEKNGSEKQTLTVTADRKKYTINIEDIIYIESMYEYLCFHTPKGKVMSLGSLKDIALKLPKETFVRISYSYVININQMISYNTTTAEMIDGVTLKVGRVYRQHFKEMFDKV